MAQVEQFPESVISATSAEERIGINVNVFQDQQ
jgi:hypothetical protein